MFGENDFVFAAELVDHRIAARAARIHVERMGEHSAPARIDGGPISVQPGVEPAFGAEFRMSAPGNVSKQACRQPEACVTGLLAGEQWRDPAVQKVAMLRKPSPDLAFFARGDREAFVGWAQPAARDNPAMVG